MSSEKTLRDIWEATDQISSNVLKKCGAMPESSKSSTITSFSGRSRLNVLDNARKTNPKKETNHQTNCTLDFNYFKENPIVEDDTTSLLSIWSPTVTDQLITTEDHNAPLICLDIPEETNLQHVNGNSILSNDSNGPLICLDIPDEKPPQDISKSILKEGDSSETMSPSSSESELSNNYGSDESQDELNETTFVKYAALPNEFRPSKSELSLSEISEATVKYANSMKNYVPNNNLKSKGGNESNKTSATQTENEPKRAPKVVIKKIYRNNPQSSKKIKVYSGSHKSPRITRKKQNKSISSRLENPTMNNLEDVLSVSCENLTIQEVRSTTGRGGKNSINIEKKIAFETREVIGKKGKRTQKITYVQGKIVEEADTDHQKKLQWNNDICDFISPTNNMLFSQNDYYRLPRNNLPINQYNRNCSPRFRGNNFSGFPSHFKYFQNGAPINRMPHHNSLEARPTYRNQSRTNNMRKEFNSPKPIHSNPKFCAKKLPARNYSNLAYSDKPYTENSQVTNRQNVLYSGQKSFTESCQKRPKDRGEFDEKIKSIVKLNEKYHQSQNPKNEVSWNVVCSSDEESSILVQEHHMIKCQTLRNRNNPQAIKEIDRPLNDTTKNDTSDHKTLQNISNSCVINEQAKTFPKKTSTSEREAVRDSSNPQVIKEVIKKSPDTTNLSQQLIQTNIQQDRFIFMQNQKSKVTERTVQSTNVGNKSLIDSIGEVEKHYSSVKVSLLKLKEEREQIKSDLILDGKEIADLIVGSHRALDIFKSFYSEWAALRLDSIALLEHILEKVMGSYRQADRIKYFATMFKSATDLVTLVPHPTVSLGARIASAVSGAVAKLFGQDPNTGKKDRDSNEFQIRETFQKDIDTSSLVYIYGVQCSSQFEETTNLINGFHEKLLEHGIEPYFNDKNVLEFLKEISEYNPRNISIFYKRLMLEYKRLLKNSQSDESRAFIRVFRDLPDAISIIDSLAWRFDTDGFDNSIVQTAWESLFDLFLKAEATNIDEFIRKLQNCVFFLKKEKMLLERAVQTLLK